MSWQAQTPRWVLNLSIFKNIIINQCEMECSQQTKMPRKVFNQRESRWARLAPVLTVFGLLRPEMGWKKKQQETREVSELWHRGTSQSHEGHREILWVSLLPISHEATGRGGWAWKWISLPYGISHGFWVETTDHLLRTLYVSGSWLGWTCLRERLARSGGLWVITAWDGC